jgi:hypothetical protein
VFSNNWISFHENGMRHCINVRINPFERQEILDMLEGKGFKTENIVDYTSAEEWFSWKEGSLLEQNEKSILRFVSSMRNCLL